MLRGCSFAFLAAGVSAAALTAQTVQVPGAIRSGVTLIPVDVRVLDRHGDPITDLGESDFTILEDGVPQPIRQFSPLAMSADAPAPGATPALRPLGAADGEPQKHRTFLIVMGRGRLQHPSKGVDAMIRFVRERLHPQDHVAVLAWNRATSFTTDHGAIAAVLERFRRDHEDVESRLTHAFSGLEALYGGGKPIPAKAQTTIDRIFAGTVDFRTVPPGRVTEAGRIADESKRAAAALGGNLAAPDVRPAGSDMSLDEHLDAHGRTSTDLENLYTGIEYLRYIDGEKRLLYVTERGLFLPRAEDDGSLAAMANDARVVLDTIHTGGVSGGGRVSASNPAPMPGPTFMESFALGSLRALSESSGGIASLYAYADEAASRIDRASRFQYLLAYAPSNTDWNGRYRKITVRVNRPNVTVQYRHGYYGRPQLVPYNRREFLTYSRVLAAALFPREISDIRVGLKTSTERADNGVSLVAEIRIALNRIRFEERDGLQQAQLDISLYTANADGKGIGEMYRKLELKLTPEEHRRALKEGVTYVMRLHTRLYPRIAKVVVYDYAADVIGTAEGKIY